MKTFNEILRDVTNSCSKCFTRGCADIRPDVVNAATKIYIAELYCEALKETELEQRKKRLTEETRKLMMGGIGLKGE